MSEENTTRVSLKDRRKGETDWARVNAASDEEIDAAIKDDPDWEGFRNVDWSNAEMVNYGAKTPISLRADADVLAFFRLQGAGYQKRINAVLRAYMLDKRKAG